MGDPPAHRQPAAGHVDDSQGARSLKRRVAEIPYLIEELKEGLGWVGLTESRIWDALAPCMALHANLIAGKPAPSSCRAAPPAGPP
jgi:hypothetical protein